MGEVADCEDCADWALRVRCYSMMGVDQVVGVVSIWSVVDCVAFLEGACPSAA